MMNRTASAVAVIVALSFGAATPSASSKKGGSSKPSTRSAKAAKPRTVKASKPPRVAKQPATRTASGVPRDDKGRIQRSAAARHSFARKTGYPNGRPGYVIDHIVPLACGGGDAPSNMQWQTIAEGKVKDKVERRGCK